MKQGGGKNKGNAFENHIARKLSLWLTGDDPTQLISSRQSGGWEARKKGTVGWRHVADLAPNGPAGDAFRRVCAVECKHYGRDVLWPLFTQQPGDNLSGWWDTLVNECVPDDLIPLLIFRQNNRPIMITMYADMAEAVVLQALVGGDVLVFMRSGQKLFGALPLTTFLKCGPSIFKQLCRNTNWG